MLFGVQPVKGIAAYDVAVERLRQRFHLGLVTPGSKLPPERRLSEQMRIARVTLREALRVLAAEGYVEIRRGAVGGAVVPDQAAFVALMQKRIRRDLAACYRALEFWEVNQVAAAILAAERRNPASLKRLRAAGANCLEAANDWGRRAAESELCLAIGAASGNAWLANATYDSLAATLLPFAKCEGTSLEFSRSTVEALLAAVESSNSAEARRCMRILVLAYGNRLRADRRSIDQLPRFPDLSSVAALDHERRIRSS